MSSEKQNQYPVDSMPVDVLLFGAHPDDVEWGAGGSVLLLKARGSSFGIVDLTRGEMGSRGTSEERDKEAQEAASSMGARFRDNLGLADCGVIDSVENRKQIASAIRRHRPKLVLAPYWKDRHPDHAATGRLIRNSAVHCTLRKSNDPHHHTSLRLICITFCIISHAPAWSSTSPMSTTGNLNCFGYMFRSLRKLLKALELCRWG